MSIGPPKPSAPYQTPTISRKTPKPRVARFKGTSTKRERRVRGSIRIPIRGRYREVAPPERLVYTLAWDGTTGHAVIETTTFEDLGEGRTKVTTRSLFDNAKERDAMLDLGMETGLAQSHVALDRLLAKLVGQGGS
jgi:uncharacterized protein YndB with AHSA1/START domain